MNINSSARFLRTLRGFTLIELMFTLSIMAILMTLAVPSFSGAFASNRLTSSTNELFTAISQAKNEAVKLGRRVTICASANGTQCSDNINGWSAGWITFVDSTRTTGSLSIDAGETVIAIGQAVPDDVIIKGGTSFLSFGADGRSRDISGGLLFNAQVRVCSTSRSLADDTRYRQISIGSGGNRIVVRRHRDIVAATAPTPVPTVPSSCPDV